MSGGYGWAAACGPQIRPREGMADGVDATYNVFTPRLPLPLIISLTSLSLLIFFLLFFGIVLVRKTFFFVVV